MGAVARAGIDPGLPPKAFENALRGEIADRGGYMTWNVDHAGWVVALRRPARVTFSGPTLDAALA